jgi:malonyl-CoA/methylmalonyl-CoA synthetase
VSLLGLYDSSLLGRYDRPALEVETRAGLARLTFGDLDQRSDRLAQCLAARGLGRGDRLALCLPNSLAVIDLWLAAMKLGAIVVPINVLYTAREIAHIVHDAAPTAVVARADRADDIPANVAHWDVHLLEDEALAFPALRPTTPLDDHTPAALVYTSGTTGAAKGAVLTHGNFVANARALVQAWEIREDDRYLAALPLFHVHGLGNGLQCWLASGCHMRLVERFDHQRAAAWFTQYRPTLFFGVPTIYIRLLETAAEEARAIGATARLFVSGSAPLPPQVLDAFEARFGHRILERYGMTETLMLVSNPLHGERRAGTVGFSLPHVHVQIRNAEGVVVPDGTAGELWVQGASLCAGYWNRPDATAAAFVDGWFRTGDLGVRAPDGRITLHGRQSDLIISGGFNIHPREIEELLLAQPGVLEAAVVGVSDPVRGEVPVAYLVTTGAFDPDALERALRTDLASFKVPREYVRVDHLPRTALGKVQKHLLPARPA